MPIDTAPEGAELLHPPVVKPFPEFSPKEPHHAQDTGGDGHNHDYDAETPQGVAPATGQKPGLDAPPPG
jgi:hypothetical protein